MTSREHPTAPTITTPNSTPGQSGRFGSESVAAFVGMRASFHGPPDRTRSTHERNLLARENHGRRPAGHRAIPARLPGRRHQFAASMGGTPRLVGWLLPKRKTPESARPRWTEEGFVTTALFMMLELPHRTVELRAGGDKKRLSYRICSAISRRLRWRAMSALSSGRCIATGRQADSRERHAETPGSGYHQTPVAPLSVEHRACSRPGSPASASGHPSA